MELRSQSIHELTASIPFNEWIRYCSNSYSYRVSRARYGLMFATSISLYVKNAIAVKIRDIIVFTSCLSKPATLPPPPSSFFSSSFQRRYVMQARGPWNHRPILAPLLGWRQC